MERWESTLLYRYTSLKTEWRGGHAALSLLHRHGETVLGDEVNRAFALVVVPAAGERCTSARVQFS